MEGMVLGAITLVRTLLAIWQDTSGCNWAAYKYLRSTRPRQPSSRHRWLYMNIYKQRQTLCVIIIIIIFCMKYNPSIHIMAFFESCYFVSFSFRCYFLLSCRKNYYLPLQNIIRTLKETEIELNEKVYLELLLIFLLYILIFNDARYQKFYFDI